MGTRALVARAHSDNRNDIAKRKLRNLLLPDNLLQDITSKIQALTIMNRSNLGG